MTPEDRIQMLQAEIDDLTAAIADRGLWVMGSRNQEILNPALAARRAAIETLRKLEASSPPKPAADPLDAWLSTR